MITTATTSREIRGPEQDGSSARPGSPSSGAQQRQENPGDLTGATFGKASSGALGNFFKGMKSFLAELRGEEVSTSATKSPAVGKIKTIDNHRAVVGQITVNGQQLDTLLSEGSFDKKRWDQHDYAAELDYRMATRAENLAYVDSLRAKVEDKSINAAEANALKTYRDRFVRDDQGGLGVSGRRVYVGAHWSIDADPHIGALFVRASTESNLAELRGEEVSTSGAATTDNHQAVVGQITVNGEQLDTLLPEGSFNKRETDQHKYAAELDYRMATRAENRAYVDSLLAKEKDKSINAAEANALKTYRNRYVADDQGGLVVDGRRVYTDVDGRWCVYEHPSDGALFVRASAESK